jgi:hypothetical protein
MTDNKNLWKPGVSGNPAGRPKKTIKKHQQTQMLDSIFDEADGNAVKFLELVLKKGKYVGLNLTDSMRLAKELACYQSPKLSSVDTKVDETRNISIQYNQPEPLKKIDEVVIDAVTLDSQSETHQDLSYELAQPSSDDSAESSSS